MGVTDGDSGREEGDVTSSTSLILAEAYFSGSTSENEFSLVIVKKTKKREKTLHKHLLLKQDKRDIANKIEISVV
jgi:hypothetical protein